MPDSVDSPFGTDVTYSRSARAGHEPAGLDAVEGVDGPIPNQ